MKKILIVLLVIIIAFLAYITLKPKPIVAPTVSDTQTQTSDTTQSTTSPSDQTGVTGMQEYTEKDFGFSFWYPTNWNIRTTNTNPSFGASITGATVTKRLWLMRAGDSSPSIVIQEAHSTTRTITDTGGAGPIGPITYYFDPKTHLWMMTSAETGQTSTTSANISNNTMGGLHIFSGTSRFDTSIVPLSADNFVVIGDNGGSMITAALTNTIIALDLSVATPVSATQQTQTIQAEANQNSSLNQSSQNTPTQTATTTVSAILPDYIGGQEGWPPVVQYSSNVYSCTPAHSQNSDTVQKTIEGRTYCIKIDNEGAAGTIYYAYTYITADTNRTDSVGTLTTNFVLAFHDTDCDAFGNAENITCHKNQSSFNVDAFVASIMKER